MASGVKITERNCSVKGLSVPALQMTCCCTLPSCSSPMNWHTSGFLPVPTSSLLVTGHTCNQSWVENQAEPAQPTASPVTPMDGESFGFLLDNSPPARLQGNAASHTQGLIGCRLKEITQSDLLCKHWPLTFTHLDAALHSITPAFFFFFLISYSLPRNNSWTPQITALPSSEKTQK